MALAGATRTTVAEPSSPRINVNFWENRRDLAIPTASLVEARSARVGEIGRGQTFQGHAELGSFGQAAADPLAQGHGQVAGQQLWLGSQSLGQFLGTGQCLGWRQYLGYRFPAFGVRSGERPVGESEVAGAVEPSVSSHTTWMPSPGTMPKVRCGKLENTAVSAATTMSASSTYSLCTVAGPLTAATIGISRSTSRCITRRPSLMVRSHCAGLVMSPRLAPSMSVMNLSPVPVSTSTRLSRSSPISYNARGKSVCSCPGCLAGGEGVGRSGEDGAERSDGGGVGLDRRSERQALDRLLAAVRAGESRALVLSGEPGAGKSALLDHLAGQATAYHVVRAAGSQWKRNCRSPGYSSCARRCRAASRRCRALRLPKTLSVQVMRHVDSR